MKSRCSRCRCVRDLPPGKKSCGPCLRRTNDYVAARNDLLSVRGLCQDCKAPCEGAYCDGHRRYRRDQARKRKSKADA